MPKFLVTVSRNPIPIVGPNPDDAVSFTLFADSRAKAGKAAILAFRQEAHVPASVHVHVKVVGLDGADVQRAAFTAIAAAAPPKRTPRRTRLVAKTTEAEFAAQRAAFMKRFDAEAKRRQPAA